MKDKVILLVDADADCAGLVLEAAARTGRGVRLSRDTREAVGIFHREFDRIDMVVLDVDPGAHGLALVEAISSLQQRLPVIVLTGLEEAHLEPVAKRHGAAECLGKPVSIERLHAAIDRRALYAGDDEVSCDPWGHPDCGRAGAEERACA